MLMQQMAPDYDHCTLMQKVEVFKYALQNTDGLDLQKVLWFKSKNSEIWLDRRTNFTRSLAVMSMVGYILGKWGPWWGWATVVVGYPCVLCIWMTTVDHC